MPTFDSRWLTAVAIAGDGVSELADGSLIERGIPVRWIMRNSLGFPRGGFDLYRRARDSLPIPVCVTPGSGLDPDATATEHFLSTTVDGTTYGFTFRASQGLKASTTCCVGGGGLRLHGQQTLEILPPQPVWQIQIQLHAAGKVQATAFEGVGTEQRAVARTSVTATAKALGTIKLTADRIDRVVLEGINLCVCSVCVVRGDVEITRDPAGGYVGWELLNTDGPIHLPVTRTSIWPGTHSHSPDDAAEADARLPPGLSAEVRDAYLSRFDDELHPILYRLVAASPQSALVLVENGVADSTTRGSRTAPRLVMSANKLLFLAALDPNIARILGLYWNDADVDTGWWYDYMIVGHWARERYPGHHVTFDTLEPGAKFFLPLRHEGVTFCTPAGISLDGVRWNGRPTAALGIPAGSSELPFTMALHTPALSVELQVIAKGELTARFYQGTALAVERTVPAGSRTIVAEGFAEFDAVTIQSDSEFRLVEVITRSQTGFMGDLAYITYNHAIDDVCPIPTPQLTTVVTLPHLPARVADVLTDAPNNVGLTWTRPPIGTGAPTAGVPVLYHVSRADITGSSAAPAEIINVDHPTLPSTTIPDNKLRPPDWPFPLDYIDLGLQDGKYRYAIRGIDFFGRLGDLSEERDIEARDASLSPAPLGVTAAYLDPDDPWLKDADATLAASHPKSVRVSWEWPGARRLQAPDMEAGAYAEFRVYTHPGPLNSIRGRVVRVVSVGAHSTLTTDQTWSGAANDLVGERVRVGSVVFRVVGNSAGAGFTLTVQNLTSPSHEPAPGEFMLTFRSASTHRADFRVTTSWTQRVLVTPAVATPAPTGTIASVENGAHARQWDIALDPELDLDNDLTPGVLVASGVAYRVVKHAAKVVIEMPDTPDDSVSLPRVGDTLTYYPGRKYQVLLDNIDLAPAETQGIALLHVGVSACDGKRHVADDPVWLEQGRGELGERPGNESIVGGPAPVTATHRTKPTAPTISATPGEEWTYAAPANYYGLAHHTLTWGPVGGADGYVLYRTSGAALLATDREQRRTRAGPTYTAYDFADDGGFASWFADQYPDLDVGDVFLDLDTLAEGSDAERAKRLRIIAFWRNWQARYYADLLPSEVQALANLDCNAAAFCRINTEPLTQTTHRDTFDGRGTGCYVWRVRTIDASGNLSALSQATVPIAIRDITPPATPIILSALGGERSITLTWRAGVEPDLAKYWVWRAGDPSELKDIRRIEPSAIVTPATGASTVSLTDADLAGADTYYYRIAAVDAEQNISNPTSVIVVRAYASS
jgi:hypothetical protein